MKTKKSKSKLRKDLLKFFLSISVAFFSFCPILAQNANTISGQIKDIDGLPIIGATVLVEGTTIGVVSDIDGKFVIEAAKGSRLNISSIGFQTQKINVENTNTLTIELLEDTVVLGDVVVVGYGTQKKESLTGAIANIKTDEIVKTKAPSLAQSIQGKVAGLRIRQNDGEPGQFRSDINVRGLGTPLFIIDGIVRDGASEFQRLNPEDIESISFLKDGTAAIYGMNSANGAIIVTTKRGQKGKTKISLSSNIGISKPTKTPRMASAAQYMELRNDAAIYGEGNPFVTKEELALWKQGALGYESTNLYDDVFKKHSIQHQHTITLQGGSDNVTYFGSLGYASDGGMLKSNDLKYEKYTFRSNVDIKIAQGLVAGLDIAGRWDENKQPWSSFYEIYKQTRINIPTTPAYANNNPDYLATQGMGINPIALADADLSGYHKYYNKNFQSTFSLKYDLPFVEGLSAKAQVGYDFNGYKHKGLRKSLTTYTYSADDNKYIPNVYNDPTTIQVNNSEANRLDFQGQLSYANTFNSVHNVSSTLVFEVKKENDDRSNIERKYDFYSYDEIDYAGLKDAISGGMSSERAFMSYVGRFNYDFKGKYLAEFGFRQDGSYRYAPGSRWAFFPMGSVGWRMSEENFIKNNFKFVDNFKFRASYGESGQDAGDAFQYIPGYNLNVGIYEFNDGTAISGIGSPSIINPNLTWYKSKMIDLGFDFSLFDGKISMEFDVYQRKRTGLLAKRTVSLPNTYGAQLPEENLESDITRGIELTLGHRNKVGDFSYNIKGNMNLARTRMDYVERGPFVSSMDRWKNQTAGRWNDFIWGYETTGQFQTYEEIRHAAVQHGESGNSKELPGDYIFKDVNGDGIIDENDQLPMYWSSTPLIHYGLTLEASWKNFDIYALFQGAAMYSVRFQEVYAEILWSKGANTPEYFFDRWHQEDPYDTESRWIAGRWPAARLVQDVGSLYRSESNVWRKDASYVRLKTLEFGYTLPSNVMKPIGIDHLRFYVNGYNLLTFCDSFVKPFDPEKVEGSYGAGLNYPLNMTFNFGFTANF